MSGPAPAGNGALSGNGAPGGREAAGSHEAAAGHEAAGGHEAAVAGAAGDADQPLPAATLTVDRVGPGGGVAADSAFGVALVSLWQTVAEAGGPVGFPPTVARAEIAAHAARIVDELRTGRLIAVAANRARRLIGVGILRPGRGVGAHTGRIELLLVEPAASGAGLGSRLLTDLLALARERGLQRLDLAIQDGAGLAAFFARFGFAEWGRRPGWIALAADDQRDEVVLGVLL